MFNFRKKRQFFPYNRFPCTVTPSDATVLVSSTNPSICPVQLLFTVYRHNICSGALVNIIYLLSKSSFSTKNIGPKNYRKCFFSCKIIENVWSGRIKKSERWETTVRPRARNSLWGSTSSYHASTTETGKVSRFSTHEFSQIYCSEVRVVGHTTRLAHLH
jgi:hypothetical protein